MSETEAAGDKAANLWRFSVRSKFLVMMLATSLVSLGTISYLAFHAGKQALTEAAINQLTSIRAAKKQQVEHYFSSIRRHLRVVADAPIVARAIEEFAAGYQALGKEPLDRKRTDALEAFYTKEFIPRAARNMDKAPLLETIWPSPTALQELQSLYIVENPHKAGERDQLVRHTVDNPYTRAHATFHPWFRAMAERMNFYDAFLIDAATSRVVYSVAKEPDLGQDLLNGPYAGTNLAQIVRDAFRARLQNETLISDYAFYLPTANEPAAFMAAPVFREQKLVGILVGQISIEALTRFVHDGNGWRQQGLGDTGQLYLVGSDMLMRTNQRNMIETPDKFIEQLKSAGAVPAAVLQRMREQRTTVLHYPVKLSPVRQALLGRTGHETIANARGLRAVFSYAPLDIPGLQWVIIGRMDESEVLASQVKFNRDVVLWSCILALLTTLAAVWLANHFTKPIQALTGGVEKLASGDRNVVVQSRTGDEFDDLVKSFNDMTATIRARDEVIETKSRAHERLLRRIFPEAVAERMKQGEVAIVETFPQVTVIYAVIDGFATLAEAKGGEASVKLLNEIVDRFDQVADARGVEKVKTIGDHYLAVVGLSVARLDHARRAFDFAVMAFQDIKAINQAHGLDLGLRIGIATGSAQAGLVGSHRFVYDIWGLAASAARRIVYEAKPNAVRLNAEAVAQLVDAEGIGNEKIVQTETLGPIKTFEAEFARVQPIKAAE